MTSNSRGSPPVRQASIMSTSLRVPARRRHHRGGRAAGQAARYRHPRTRPDVLVAGLAHSVRDDVFGRPGGPHSRGQGAVRGGRAGPAWSPGGQGLLGQWDRHWPQVGLGGGAGVPTVFDGLRRRRGRGAEGQARDVAGHFRQTVGVTAPRPQASMPSAPAGTRRQPTGARFAINCTGAGRRDLRYRAGRADGEDNIQVRSSEQGTRSIPAR